MNRTNQTISTAPPPVYLDVDALAKRWDTSGMHVRRLIRDGRLDAINIGTSRRRARWRIKFSDVEAFERLTQYKPRIA